MASSESSIRKVHESIVTQKLSPNTTAKWTIFSAARGLKVEEDYDGNTVREGEITDFVKDFTSPDYEGSILFALVKLKIPNTQPAAEKCALLEWCDTNAPPLMRNNFFPGQSNALKKLLPGYNVPMEVRSREDLTPDDVLQKIGGAAVQGSSRSGPPPPVASKPVVSRPTRVGGGGAGFNPLSSNVRAAPSGGSTDADGWGADAPPVSRSKLEPVQSAYKPTKVDIGQIRSQHQASSYQAPARDDTPSDVVKGGYQPIGKVDIAAIRKQAKESGSTKDDRPTTVKGAYEPIGKVDIAAIRAKAQGPGGASSPAAQVSPTATGASAEEDETPKSLAERSAAFSQSERIASLPKPKVANKFGGSGNFAGTKAPTPAGFAPKPTSSAPVGIASRTFADEGGKTPAQIWAEKKARQGGAPSAAASSQPLTSQQSGDAGWKSGYAGKSWAPVQTTKTGGSNISAQRTGQDDREPEREEEAAASPAGVGAIRDRFKDAGPISMGAPPPAPRGVPEPPSMDMSSKPNAGSRGVPIPGLPTRPGAADEDDYPEEQTQQLPPPPAQPRSPSPPTPDEMRSASPIRVAMPVGRGASQQEEEPAQSLPVESLSKVVSAQRPISDEPQVEDDDLGRSAAQTLGGSAAPAAASGGLRALIQYDYDPAEDNELELREGDYVTNIDQVDEDWWMGTNSKGEAGLFPSNYVELLDDEPAAAAAPPPAARPTPAAPAAPAAPKGNTATAQYDYEAAEDNELSFPDGATITGVEFPDEDWWFGHYGGKEGLFPANYVQLDQ